MTSFFSCDIFKSLKGEDMSNLLAKRYHNNKVKTQANAQNGKKLDGKRKVSSQKESEKKVKTEHITVVKEPKTLILD